MVVRLTGGDQRLCAAATSYRVVGHKTEVGVEFRRQTGEPCDRFLFRSRLDTEHDLTVRRELDTCTQEVRTARGKVEQAERSPWP